MTEITPTVPFVQMSDLNDGDILSGTRKMSDGGGGIVLAYTLPSGQELKSDPVQAELIGKAMIGWIDAVKNRIIEDAQSAQDAGLRKAREAQLAAGNGRSLADYIPASEPTAAELRAAGVPELRPAPSMAAALSQPPTDESPKELAQRRVRELKATMRFLRAQLKERLKAEDTAREQLREWEGVVAGLTKKRAAR